MLQVVEYVSSMKLRGQTPVQSGYKHYTYIHITIAWMYRYRATLPLPSFKEKTINMYLNKVQNVKKKYNTKNKIGRGS
jgi:hypothetical protein